VTDDGELLVRREGALGRLTLNRPEALGALTLGMCEIMTAALVGWRGDPAIETVLIDHQGARGFCAGGDIRMLAESGARDGVAARHFFHTEYRLNHLLSIYEKPIVVLMDGVTMGGGVGLALPARYRVATERTRFAMPETGIGLFPDVGGGWWLPRLPDRAGLWVVLTGARLATADCLHLGIATHAVDSAALGPLRRALAKPGADVGAVLAACAGDPGPAPIEPLLPYLAGIFGRGSLEAIVSVLERDGGDWAKAQLAAMAAKCPASAKVSFRLLSQERPASLAENLVTEYRLASRLVMRHDFLEGVRAVIVDKDNRPSWRPASLAEMTDALVDEIFAPLPAGEEWTPLETAGG
jgi:enoyl-CoA hydratase